MTHPAVSGKTATAVRYLRKHISSGEWTLNSKIPREDQLMADIGVGKSTLREAVRSLANLGMLEPLRGIGTFVRSRTPVNAVCTDYIADFPVRDILGYRNALEIESARQAALHRTPEHLRTLSRLLRESAIAGAESSLPLSHIQAPGSFHQTIVEASGNALLVDMHACVIAAIRDSRQRGHITPGDDPARRQSDHAAILAALHDGDPDAAAAAMAAHVNHDITPDAG